MILLGIGSNLSSHLGDRFKNIDLAISYLEENKIKIIKKSSYYETLAYPKKDDPKFINIVVLIQTNLNPLQLMSILINIEEKLERKRNKKNDPRTCDIDIISYNNDVINFNYKNFDLFIPHPKLELRNFVLFPLKEILPDWKHPKTKETISGLIKKLSYDDRKSILKIKKN